MGYWYLTIPLGALLFIYHFVTSITEYVNKKEGCGLREAKYRPEKSESKIPSFCKRYEMLKPQNDDEEEILMATILPLLS